MKAPATSSSWQAAGTAAPSPPVIVEAPHGGPPPPHLTLAFVTLSLLAQLGGAFCQQRTALRAWRMAVGQALTLGSRMISRIIASLQRDQRDWSADYRLARGTV